MSCDVDELDVNPFFRALQSTYLDLYEKAQDKCYVVCIPQKSSLIGVAINQKLIDTHILRPSPYFKGQYLSGNVSGDKTVTIEENGQIIKTLQGFPEKKVVNVLTEELAYNKNYQHYKILIIDSPLDSKPESNSLTQGTALNVSLKHTSTFIESKLFLQSFKDYTKIILQLDKTLTEFNQHYMVIADYLFDAGDRIQSMINDTAGKCLKCSRQKIQSDHRYKDVLYGAVESYILGMVHNKIYGVICEKKKKEDKDLLDKCHQLHNVTPVQLGVHEQFSCSLPQAVKVLDKLNGLCTPREKLNCLKDTIDSITDGLEEALAQIQQKQLSLEKTDMPCLTSDELIPLLVTVIARAECSHIESDLYYMENFNWNSTDMDSISYCLVTFKAAVQFMQASNFDHLKNPSPKLKREMSLGDMMALTKLSDEATPRDSLPVQQAENKSLRIDRQLNKISNFLHVQDTKKDAITPPREDKKIRSIFNEPPKRYSPRNISSQDPKQDENPLGDFLSSLQDDMFDQPFGKQT